MTAAVEVHNLTKTYRSGWLRARRITALRGVSLTVPRGGIFGLLGPNGAGKTTLIKILLGIVRPGDGTATILDQPAGSRLARRRIGYLPENHRFPRHLTAAAALEYYGGLSGLTPRSVRAKQAELLALVGLTGREQSPVREFSKGMQQRLGLAQSLLADPELLILDEPTDGVDPVGRAELREVLLSQRAAGKTIFLNSHHLQEMELVCDRVAIMNGGRIIRTGTIAELTAEPTVRVALRGSRHTAQLILNQAGIAAEALADEAGNHLWRLPELPPERWDRLVDAWRAADLSLSAVIPERRTLEESFLATLSTPVATA